MAAVDTHVIINVVNVVDASDDNALSGCSRHIVIINVVNVADASDDNALSVCSRHTCNH